MGARSNIEWTDASWTPLRARVWEIQDDGSGKERIGWHCEHVSDGCRVCYAETINRRLGTGRDFKPGERYRPEREGYHNGEVKLFLDEAMLLAPLRWRKPRMIFVCSMTDLFAEFVPDEWIDRVFAVMAMAPQHTFQVLTKRAERMREYLSRIAAEPLRDTILRFAAAMPPSPWPPFDELVFPLPHVWLGVSAERQQEWDERMEHLRATPAAVTFVSAEPLLGPIEARPCRYCNHPGNIVEWPCRACGGRRFELPDWVIVGGESGPKARPMHPQWARDIRDQCAAAGVPFFFKQWGEWGFTGDVFYASRDAYFWPYTNDGAPGPVSYLVGKARAGRVLDGVTHDAMPGRE
jgi:protein gp37